MDALLLYFIQHFFISGLPYEISSQCRQGRREGGGGGNWGILPWVPLCLWAPKRSIYSNRTVKCSIKAVTTYICDLICKNPEQSRIYGYSVSCIFVLYGLQALLFYNMKPVL